jgi:hypothetical protein
MMQGMATLPQAELTIEEAMEMALGLQRAGDLDSADELYRRILTEAPERADPGTSRA